MYYIIPKYCLITANGIYLRDKIVGNLPQYANVFCCMVTMVVFALCIEINEMYSKLNLLAEYGNCRYRPANTL